MAVTNRRRSPRRTEQAVVQVLHSPHGVGENRKNLDLFPATMCNCSQDGLYIETDRAFEPGSSIRSKK